MADNESEKTDWKKISLTPIREGEDGSNNYNEFKMKAMFKLDAAGYWKFVGGPEYNPPAIPEWQISREVEGIDAQGNIV